MGGWEIFTRNGGVGFIMGGWEISKVSLHSWQSRKTKAYISISTHPLLGVIKG